MEKYFEVKPSPSKNELLNQQLDQLKSLDEMGMLQDYQMKIFEGLKHLGGRVSSLSGIMQNDFRVMMEDNGISPPLTRKEIAESIPENMTQFNEVLHELEDWKSKVEAVLSYYAGEELPTTLGNIRKMRMRGDK